MSDKDESDEEKGQGAGGPQPGAGKDPRQTDHPTGKTQAAENAEEESPA